MKRKLFSERHADINKVEYIFPIEQSVRKGISDILSYFYNDVIEEPKFKYNPSLSFSTSNERLAWADLYQLHNLQGKPDFDREILIKDEFFLFDLIESWDFYTNDKEFSIRINNLFQESEIPFRLLNGKIIKIDSKQFECDLLYKHLKELKDLNFVNAYNELVKAIEYLDNGKYDDSIMYAEKSYESVVKIVCNISDGQIDSIISNSLNLKLFNDLPKQINKNGFKNSVLTSLPYIRNQTKVGHGIGNEEIIIPKSLAKLSINLCCALSTYYIEIYRITL